MKSFAPLSKPLFFSGTALGLLLCSLLMLTPQACSPPGDCTGEIGKLTLDPNESQCTQKCECNNQRYVGDCIQKRCVSIEREPCLVKGLERKCLAPKELSSSCREGLQLCQPDYLTEKRWGNCQLDCRPCEPGDTRPCYNGPEGTPNQGRCRIGIRKCAKDGYWGFCDGQVLPAAEELCNDIDDNCNGKVDDKCRSIKPEDVAVFEPTPDAGPQEAAVEPAPEPAPEPAVDLGPPGSCSIDSDCDANNKERCITWLGLKRCRRICNPNGVDAATCTPQSSVCKCPPNLKCVDLIDYTAKRSKYRVCESVGSTGKTQGQSCTPNGETSDCRNDQVCSSPAGSGSNRCAPRCVSGANNCPTGGSCINSGILESSGAPVNACF